MKLYWWTLIGAVTGLLAWFVMTYARVWSYRLFYEDLVIETIRRTVQ